MVARGTTLPPSSTIPSSSLVRSHHFHRIRVCCTFPLAHPFTKRNRPCEWSQGYKSRRGSFARDRSSARDVLFFFFFVRSECSNHVWSGNDFREPRFSLHPFKFKEDFFYRFFSLSFLTTLSRGSSDKESAVNFQWLLCDSNLPLQGRSAGIFRQRGCFSFRRIRQTESTIFIVCMIIFLTERTSSKRTPLLFFPSLGNIWR